MTPSITSGPFTLGCQDARSGAVAGEIRAAGERAVTDVAISTTTPFLARSGWGEGLPFTPLHEAPRFDLH